MDRPGIAPPPLVKGGGSFFGSRFQGGGGLFVLKEGGGLIKGGTLRRDWKENLKNFYLFAKMTPKITIFIKKLAAATNFLTYFNKCNKMISILFLQQ